MDIESYQPRRVIYAHEPDDDQVKWGFSDPRGLLTLGETYEVESIEYHSWYTKIFLVGVDSGRGFNIVSFEDPDSSAVLDQGGVEFHDGARDPSARADLDLNQIEARHVDNGGGYCTGCGLARGGGWRVKSKDCAVRALVAEVKQLRDLVDEFRKRDEAQDRVRKLLLTRERDAARAEAERLREMVEQKRGGQIGYFIAAMTETLERITTERNAFRDERNEAREALQAVRDLCDEWANTGNNPDDLWLDKGRADFRDRVRRLLPEAGA